MHGEFALASDVRSRPAALPALTLITPDTHPPPGRCLKPLPLRPRIPKASRPPFP